ncbi:MAG: hypothetical protein A2898_02825 [Candidatus Kerfeldbacteria bacterium RIFCSPLOWO2_01_FULL_48_11]|uniref:Peptidase S8/S53 domain-containing protein n=1 Tax=Candidatus Kerfeldbacteria bacterium RIFCSPLOWO2_01_FULL_48_11 TaxID=1798543 RepID=A0A1G2B9U7_9BACT|nr:MAG: hypothetical protein A2898_02825 [Candidatus Kerfeldbacteria bacterium RIFCSPLOWO2_01_FULL_48_11]
MREFRQVMVVLFFGALLIPAVCQATESDLSTREVLVKYRSDPHVKLIRLNSGVSYHDVIGGYALNPAIEYIEPNAEYRATLIPDDTYFASQWSLDIAGASQAWDSTTGDASVVIAIVDSGVQIDHPDLAANVWVNTDEIAGNAIDDDHNGYVDDRNGWDFAEDTQSPKPKFHDGWTTTGIHHGTVVAGIAAAVGNNAKGIAGVAYSATIMPIRVLDHTGHGSTLTVAEGVQYAAENGADIINLSFVGNTYSATLAGAISQARSQGILVVASAGNDGVDLDVSPRYPVCDDDVIGVAATDSSDQKTSFSNYGSCVDISAPGINMYGTVVYDVAQGLTEYYQTGWYGTSASAPFISGALALAKSHNLLQTAVNLETALGETAFDISTLNAGYANDLGAGRVNLSALLQSEQLSFIPGNIVVSREPGASPLLHVYNEAGDLTTNFYAFAENFTGGVHVATADLSGDGSKEILAGAGPGGAPHVRIHSSSGKLVGSFFAYNATFRGGVNVTAGDLDGNGTDEILAGAGNGGAPHVRIFNGQGDVIGFFYAYDPSFRGGVNVAAGDVNGDGTDEIITGAGPGGAPHVRIFSHKGVLVGQFFAYPTAFRGGVNVAAGDVNGDGTDEIITGAGPGGAPHVRVLNKDGALITQFYAFDVSERTGITVGGL